MDHGYEIFIVLLTGRHIRPITRTEKIRQESDWFTDSFAETRVRSKTRGISHGWWNHERRERLDEPGEKLSDPRRTREEKRSTKGSRPILGAIPYQCNSIPVLTTQSSYSQAALHESALFTFTQLAVANLAPSPWNKETTYALYPPCATKASLSRNSNDFV